MDKEQFRPSWLDVPISIFKRAIAHPPELLYPEGETTLRRIVSTSHYRGQIKAIRAEPDEEKQKEHKKQLRAFTPVARLNHRKKNISISEQVNEQWPMLAADVDAKDNPGVGMSELKKHLCRLPYLLLCAYSVRGGLWFVVRLPDHQTPDTLAAHFRYLQLLFNQKFGIRFQQGQQPDRFTVCQL